jgi:hypothetical protein
LPPGSTCSGGFRYPPGAPQMATLEPGGYIVIEALVPALQRLRPAETVGAFTLTPGRPRVRRVRRGGPGRRFAPLLVGRRDAERVVHASALVRPSEFDLMARLAGMTFRARWSGWKGETFTADSTEHISVWQKPLTT